MCVGEIVVLAWIEVDEAELIEIYDPARDVAVQSQTGTGYPLNINCVPQPHVKQ